MVSVAPAAAGTVFSNTSSIGLNNPTTAPGEAAASLYPSPITVSGLTGNISDLTVTLSGINFLYSEDISALLVSPTGQSLVLFSSVGSNDQSTATDGLDVTLSDVGITTYSTGNANALPTTGSVTMVPTDLADNFTPDGIDAAVFPSPAPQETYGEAAPTGSDTLNSTFDGNGPNGTWDLYVTTDTSGDGTGIIAGGWSLNITTASTEASTTTDLTSNQNPAFTSGTDSSVTLTAAVKASGTPVTAGTVDFTDGGTTISGCGAATLDGNGDATCDTTFTTEGDHALEATYSGASGNPTYVTSSDSLQEEVNNHTVVSGTTYSNPGAISVPNFTGQPPGTAVPYPSNIYVSGVTGTITSLRVTLSQISYQYTQDLNALLVGPGGQSLVLLGNVGPSTGTTNASDVTVTFEDSASAIPQSTPLGDPDSTVTSAPVDYTADDSFPAPAPAGPYGTPAPAGSATLGSTFDTTNPDGTWTLYLVTDGAGDGAGTVAGGWNITFAQTSQSIMFTSTAPTDAVVGGPTYTPMATGGGSGEPVVFSIDPSSTAGACSITSGVVSFTGPGTCLIDANQAGNGSYEQATQMTQTVDVTDGLDVTVTGSETFGSSSPSFAAAPASGSLPAGTSLSGTVSCTEATSNGPDVPISSSLAAGPYTVVPSSCTGLSLAGADAGDYSVELTGGAFTVSQASQTVVFTSYPPTASVGESYTVAAAASSGEPVVFTTTTPGVCGVSGDLVTFVAPGTCVVDASQAGTGDYLPASAELSIVAEPSLVTVPGPVTQTVHFTSTPSHAAYVGGTYTLAAVASSGLAVTYTAGPASVCAVAGDVVSFVGDGTCTITATQVGNDEYASARASQVIEVTTASTLRSTLTGGHTLTAGQSLTNGGYHLVLRPDGNLVLYDPAGRALWDTGTAGDGVDRLVLQSNGNLVLLSASNTALWSSDTAGDSGDQLDVDGNGDVTITSPGGTVLWTMPVISDPTVIRDGQSLWSNNRSIRAVLQADGNLVVYDASGHALWDSHTQGNPGDRLVLQTDGNLVIYDASGRALWDSHTQGNPGDHLAVQADGNLVIYSATGRAIWDTGTNA